MSMAPWLVSIEAGSKVVISRFWPRSHALRKLAEVVLTFWISLSLCRFDGPCVLGRTCSMGVFIVRVDFAELYPRSIGCRDFWRRLYEIAVSLSGGAAVSGHCVHTHFVGALCYHSLSSCCVLLSVYSLLAIAFLHGVFSFLTPGEGGLGGVYDDLLVARTLHDAFASFAENRGEGYNRWQFRQGQLQLLSKIEKAHTNLPTQDLIACLAS